jgi:phospholipase/lecithinase/hemolysin
MLSVLRCLTRSWIAIPVLMVWLAAPSSAGAQSPSAPARTIGQIVFFGDSLTDSGNHFIYAGTSSRQPFTLEAPDASYDIGGHHFSDGDTWAEDLATTLHTPTSGSPALRVPGVFTNYAVGRARARAGAPQFPDFDLRTQVSRYLADFGGAVPQNTLVAIWIGGTDVEDGLNAFLIDPSGVTTAGILQDALVAIADSVGALYAAGARMFLIVNIPSLAYTPYVRFLDANVYPGIAGAATGVTTSYDIALGQLVSALPALLPPDSVHPLQFVSLLDTNGLIGDIVAAPSSFGIADPLNRCTVPGVVGHAICSTPHQYLFWDGIHPTTTGHRAVAQAALQLLPPQ